LALAATLDLAGLALLDVFGGFVFLDAADLTEWLVVVFFMEGSWGRVKAKKVK
jgi:hypothetical protein